MPGNSRDSGAKRLAGGGSLLPPPLEGTTAVHTPAYPAPLALPLACSVQASPPPDTAIVVTPAPLSQAIIATRTLPGGGLKLADVTAVPPVFCATAGLEASSVIVPALRTSYTAAPPVNPVGAENPMVAAPGAPVSALALNVPSWIAFPPSAILSMAVVDPLAVKAVVPPSKAAP